jgi:geranylgeranyl reductase family protein
LTPDRDLWDVAVVGAGPAGSSAAYWLARRGVRVNLVDKSEFPRDKTCGDGLAPRAVAALDRMGVLPRLAAPRITRARIVGATGEVESSFGPPQSSYPRYALLVRRREFDETLLRHAVEAGATFTGGLSVSRLTLEKHGIVIHGRRHGQPVSVAARLAVLAVGANFSLLRTLGMVGRPSSMILASRAYFENLDPQVRMMDFYLDDVIMPGYGWVFPFGDGTANVGAGVEWRPGRTTVNGTAAFHHFVKNSPGARRRLQGARQVGPVAGYPLRTDFLTARTSGERMLLVGEAAGLMNVFTGDGIDFALESGELAAQFAVQALRDGDLSRGALRGYDALLRARFRSDIRATAWLRRIYLSRPIARRFLRSASRHPELPDLCGGVFTLTVNPWAAMAPRMLKYLLG